MDTPLAAELFPAGEHLADELDARELTHAEFATILGRPAQFVSEIISGKKEITRESAAQIGAALGTSAEIWLNLQNSYLLWQQSQDAESQQSLAEIQLRAKMHELAPVALLVQRGFMTPNDVNQQAREVMDLFEISSIDEAPRFQFAARRSNTAERTTGLQQAWAACVRSVAKKLPVARFNHEALQHLAGNLSRLARDPSSFANFQSMFAEVGVKLVYIESFPGGKLDGCALLDGGTPVIGLSGRGKRLDKILFTLLHEVSHVLLGHLNNDEVILDDFAASDGAREDDADQLASTFAVAGEIPQTPARIDSSWIRRVADDLQVAPIVLIGHLQQAGVVARRTTLVRDAPTVIEHLSHWKPVRT
ncbi:HigA family addiction module antitoxin [Gordonia sp. (in: high G+C Gram-positive bacteria)]|uniref:HigA family addiction module antitoxin n=1 Tax=Gordonia sp. (in: high G+C Gram-positive bacteria) TaxID=84139 RepID=UPI0016928AC1|nr:HigA family addiction module antitoxin [Gordonia sp. (in: high G+C Gram-positive bacteria)]NLG45850.1 HigA family addiction module antidote protein [Gordonia sp. (in: high G+C Gram-positive bacteria)]